MTKVTLNRTEDVINHISTILDTHKKAKLRGMIQDRPIEIYNILRTGSKLEFLDLLGDKIWSCDDISETTTVDINGKILITAKDDFYGIYIFI